MKNIIKGLFVFALAAAFVAPSMASAVTVEEMQAQIAALLAQLTQLQKELATAQGDGQTQWCHTFNRNLRIDDQNSEVTNLVRALVKEGLLDSDEMFQDGRQVLNFDEGVASAVSAFQEKYADEILTPNGLKNGNGYVGKSTRAKLNQLYGCGGKIPITLPPVRPTPVSVPALKVYATESGYDVSTLIRNHTYQFGAKVANGRPNSQVLFYLQAPNGSYEYQGADVGSVGKNSSYTDSDGDWNGSIAWTIANEGQNGQWAAWVTVGGVPSNKGYLSVRGSSPVSAVRLYISANAKSIKVGEGAVMQAMYQPPMPPCPQGAACAQVMPDPYPVEARWKVYDSNIAAVYGEEKDLKSVTVKGLAAGRTTVSATYVDSQVRGGEDITATAEIQVLPAVVIPTPSITVLSPNGGETYAAGTAITATWTQNYNSNPLVIRLFDSNSGKEYYSGKSSGSIGKNLQVLPPEASNVPSGRYRITICDENQVNPVTFKPLCDSGDAPFSIVAGASSVPTSTISAVPTLAVSLDSSTPASQTVAAGRINVTFAKIKLTAGSQAVNNMNAIQVGSDSPNASALLTNIKVYDGSVQLGTTVSNLIYNGSYYYQWIYVNGVSIPANASKVLTVVADVQLTALSGAVRLGIAGWNFNAPGARVVSPGSTAIYGVNMTIATITSLSVSISSNTAPAKQVAMGRTNNSLATFRFTETGARENINIQTLKIKSITSGTSVPGFTNVRLYKDNVLVGGPAEGMVSGANSWVYTFNFPTLPVVPRSGSVEFELRGDAAGAGTGGAVSNAKYIFKIESAGDVTAFGESSAFSVLANLAASEGNAMTVLKTRLTVSGSALGATTGRTRSAVDDIANLTFTADPAGDASISQVGLALKGTAGIGKSFSASLIDPSTGIYWAGSSPATCSPFSTAGCAINFVFPSRAVVSAGSAKTVKIRIDSSSLNEGTLTASIDGQTWVMWNDGVSNVNLEASAAPVAIANVSYEGGTTTQPKTGTVIVAWPKDTTMFWSKGETYQIIWNSSGFGSDAWAQIQLRDNADTSKTTKLIVNSVSGTSGTYNWTVPSDIPDGEYRIWISMGSGNDSLGTRVLGSAFSNVPVAITAIPPSEIYDSGSGGGGAMLAPQGNMANTLSSMAGALSQLERILNSLR